MPSRDNDPYFRHLRRVVDESDPALSDDAKSRAWAEGERVHAEVLAPLKLAGRTILLVGGAGYIGTPLTAALLERGYGVVCLDLLLYRNQACVTPFLGHPRYRFVRGDLADAAAIERALEGVSDAILLAGLVGDPITARYPEHAQAINDEGMASLIARLKGRGLNKLVFVSTCSNYGEIPADATADEEFPLKPLSLYAKAKVRMEGLVRDARGNADYCATVLRFATAFGLSGRMRFDLTVSEFTRDLFAGRTLEVYDADTWRPYCHVRDFARALIRVLEAPRADVAFEVFNAGGDVNNFTKGMIVDAVRKELPRAQFKFVEGGRDRRNYRVDFAKIRRVLGFEPRVTVADGIRELVAALGQGFFADYDDRLDFYRNREIAYQRPR
ncbi:MAG TPA: NAD(P)-dependent oxidoreductase [Alphaproteobacteria bacterium]|nr:NAD(P)-dependent oxidoreductase [Alphaproteobacteria bacterium]